MIGVGWKVYDATFGSFMETRFLGGSRESSRIPPPSLPPGGGRSRQREKEKEEISANLQQVFLNWVLPPPPPRPRPKYYI